MARYGDRLGMAFQIVDDIIDYTENESVTGKPGGLDLREHKVTLPLIAAQRRTTPAGRKRIEELFGDESPNEELIRDVIGIVTEAGGIDAARQRGKQFAAQAEAALQSIPTSSVRSALLDAITYVLD